MTREEIEKMRLGMACCIRANQTHHCPPECPYTDCTVGATYTYCEGALLLEARAYIEQLEQQLEGKEKA